jgi:hypothetical protein
MLCICENPIPKFQCKRIESLSVHFRSHLHFGIKVDESSPSFCYAALQGNWVSSDNDACNCASKRDPGFFNQFSPGFKVMDG